VLSDPVALEAPAQADLAVSLHLPQATAAATTHFMALQTSYVSPPKSDATAAARFPVARTITSWPFLAGVEVQASPRGKTIVAFGDSTIDGDGSTPDTNRRWPDVLAGRLQQAGAAEVGVLNQGIIGNRLLRDSPRDARNPIGPGFGPSGLARFESDALGQPGVACVILRLGINDIGLPGSFASPKELPTAGQMIAGYRRLIAQARQRGVRIVGSTLAPFEGIEVPGYHSAAKDALRQAVNAWIRHGGEFDAVIDVDQILRDPARPARLLAAYDSGDHLHPSDAGYAAVANAVPLALLGIAQ
jgi:lysophospholipase L1-like esterase